jgi:hypothetical protein
MPHQPAPIDNGPMIVALWAGNLTGENFVLVPNYEPDPPMHNSDLVPHSNNAYPRRLPS